MRKVFGDLSPSRACGRLDLALYAGANEYFTPNRAEASTVSDCASSLPPTGCRFRFVDCSWPLPSDPIISDRAEGHVFHAPPAPASGAALGLHPCIALSSDRPTGILSSNRAGWKRDI